MNIDLNLPPPMLLPPQHFPEKPTLVLDMDHTLIVATKDHPPERYDFITTTGSSGHEHLDTYYYVLKRPGLDDFLEKMAAKYELVIFTSGLSEYASPIVDGIDPRGLISHRLYRDSCTRIEGQYVKKLDAIGRELKKVILVEDRPEACVLNKENAILVLPFDGNLEDRELEMVGEFLEGCSELEDLTVAVKQFMVMDEGMGDDDDDVF